jgi:hypothetical protein
MEQHKLRNAKIEDFVPAASNLSALTPEAQVQVQQFATGLADNFTEAFLATGTRVWVTGLFLASDSQNLLTIGSEHRRAAYVIAVKGARRADSSTAGSSNTTGINVVYEVATDAADSVMTAQISMSIGSQQVGVGTAVMLVSNQASSTIAPTSMPTALPVSAPLPGCELDGSGSSSALSSQTKCVELAALLDSNGIDAGAVQSKLSEFVCETQNGTSPNTSSIVALSEVIDFEAQMRPGVADSHSTNYLATEAELRHSVIECIFGSSTDSVSAFQFTASELGMDISAGGLQIGADEIFTTIRPGAGAGELAASSGFHWVGLGPNEFTYLTRTLSLRKTSIQSSLEATVIQTDSESGATTSTTTTIPYLSTHQFGDVLVMNHGSSSAKLNIVAADGDKESSPSWFLWLVGTAGLCSILCVALAGFVYQRNITQLRRETRDRRLSFTAIDEASPRIVSMGDATFKLTQLSPNAVLGAVNAPTQQAKKVRSALPSADEVLAAAEQAGINLTDASALTAFSKSYAKLSCTKTQEAPADTVPDSVLMFEAPSYAGLCSP